MAEQIYVSPNRCKNEKELNDFIDEVTRNFVKKIWEKVIPQDLMIGIIANKFGLNTTSFLEKMCKPLKLCLIG